MAAIRRGASFLALLGLMSASLEMLVPDVHDGDVPTEVATASDTPAPSDDAPARTPPGIPSPTHAAHIDHCAHSHLLDAGTKVCYAQVESHPPMPAMPTVLRPASVSLSPDQRPPIA